MNIKKPLTQIVEEIESLNHLISRQERRVKRAQKRFRIKEDWAFSFWIWDNSYILDYIYRQEYGILNALKFYKRELQEKGNKLRDQL